MGDWNSARSGDHTSRLAERRCGWRVELSPRLARPARSAYLVRLASQFLTAFVRARGARSSDYPSASATRNGLWHSLLLRFALWYCVRIRAKETFAVEVDHMVGIFGNPNLGFPSDM